MSASRRAKNAAPTKPRHKDLRALLDAPQGHWRGGVRCQTCALPDLKLLNADLRLFVESRANGHPMPWSAFVREWLAPTYGYPYGAAAARKHVAKCLGVKDAE
jgi:hypothetical protein